MKGKLLKTLFTVAVVIFVACALAMPASARLPKKVVIGGTISLSGKFAKEGQQSVWGVKAVEKWVNSVHGGIKIKGKSIPVEYKYYDDESKKETVTSLCVRLIKSDRVKFILAPYSSGLTLAGAPIVDKYGVLYMSHGGASDRIFDQGYSYVVQTLSPASKYQTAPLDMIHQLDPSAKKIAFLFEDGEFSRAVARGAAAHAKKLGFQIVFNRTYPKAAKDLTPVLTELKAAHADVLIGGGHFADGQLLAKQLGDMAIDFKAVSILVAPTLPGFYKALGTMAESFMAPGQWGIGAKYSPQSAKSLGLPYFGPTQQVFMDYFLRESNGVNPDYHGAEAAAAFLAYVYAIEKANSLNPDDVRETMNKLHFMTFFGEWKIDPETGKQVAHDMVVLQWQGKKLQIIWPPAAQTSKPFYPMLTTKERAAGKLAIPR